jgi:hypothetical protein
MVRVHVKLKMFPHLHKFVLDGVEYINECFEGFQKH